LGKIRNGDKTTMLANTIQLLTHARQEGYSIGAFNIYNLEEAIAVVKVAELLDSPVILQMLPKALEIGGSALIKLCLEAGRSASVPVSVHLDHCASEAVIGQALAGGMRSIMADGSHLAYQENIRFTRRMVELVGRNGGVVEAELGRLTGTEDGLTVDQKAAQLTDPDQAAAFVGQTGAAALAVCIGNVHGRYPRRPELDFDRLEAIGQRVPLPLVLHGTSGLPDAMILESIRRGVCKFNVNTELRQAYIRSAREYLAAMAVPELVDLMQMVIEGVKQPVQAKMELFGSLGKARA
jgi:tagatose 1,6-diphosphate aldolase GatY/KbaY